MKSPKQADFLKEYERLCKKFEADGRAGEDDADLADALMTFVLERERLRRGVAPGSVEAEAVDAETLAAIKTWDTDDPLMVVYEKALRQLAEGNGSRAVGLLERAVIARATALSKEQSRKAKSPRQVHPVDVLIEEIVKGHRNITSNDLKNELLKRVGRGTILDMDDEHIHPTDPRFPAIKVSGLKDRMSRIKQQFAKAG